MKEYGIMIREKQGSKIQKTIRSELIRMLVSTCLITMLVVGVVLTVIIFRWSSMKARDDMEFYMESVQQQFSDRLLFLEESVTYLSANDTIDEFFLYDRGSEEEIQKVLEQGVNLFSSRNLISESFPVVKDYYVFNKNMRYVGTHFYPETQTAITQTNVRLIEGIGRYEKQDQMFYYRKNGKEVECYFSIYDDQLERKGYCVAILDMASIERIFSQLSKYELYYWGILSDEKEAIGGSELKGFALDSLEDHEGMIEHQKTEYLYRMNQHSFGLSAYILIPENKLYLNILPQFQMAWIISLSMVVAVVASVIFYSRKFTKPLQNIVEKIEQVGAGDLNMQYTPQGDMSLTGRYTLSGGVMKYSLPIIPLKEFQFNPGSYVDWRGNIMNPTLSLKATERMRASVADGDGDGSRMVNFDVSISIKNRLDAPDLIFDISAPEDAAVENELQAMGAEERSKQAIAMLATGIYLNSGAKGGGLSMGAALNSVLQSQINSLAGGIKGANISVGVEDRTSAETGDTQKDFSFRYSQRFFNDRVQIVIGGKVSTGANATNDAESFIDNISLEYRLDASGTRYVRVFHNKNYESILDGEITETGVGLVLRRKMDRLSELFIFRKKKIKPEAENSDMKK